MKEKQSKCSVKYISYLYKRLSPRTSSREIDYVKKITNYISVVYVQASVHFHGNLQALNMGLFTLCPCLKTKESYDRWVTRRVWGFRHQISKAKNLKMSIVNIGKLQEKFHCIVQNGCEIFAAKGQHIHSQRLISQSCTILPSA